MEACVSGRIIKKAKSNMIVEILKDLHEVQMWKHLFRPSIASLAFNTSRNEKWHVVSFVFMNCYCYCYCYYYCCCCCCCCCCFCLLLLLLLVLFSSHECSVVGRLVLAGAVIVFPFANTSNREIKTLPNIANIINKNKNIAN